MTSRARLCLFALVPGALTAGCSHVQQAGRADAEAVEALRQDHAQLRRRVAALEGRLHQLEREVDPEDPSSWEALPVVRLGPQPDPPEPAPSPRGAGDKAPPPNPKRLRSPVSLSAIAAPDFSEPGDDGLDEALGAPRPRPASAPAPARSVDDGRSYRLVGSQLVQATQQRKVRPDRPPRGKAGNAIIAEYQAARSLYLAGELEAAELAFASFVARHPEHDYADNALYWQGEAAYDLERYRDALAAFTEVVERYAGGNKAPDALLKIGLCYGRLGDLDNARDVLEHLVLAYPRAEAAGVARVKLSELED